MISKLDGAFIIAHGQLQMENITFDDFFRGIRGELHLELFESIGLDCATFLTTRSAH